MMKKCPVCKIIKSKTEFNKSSKKDGLMYYCKKCQGKSVSAYYQKHKKERLVYAKQYRLLHKKEMKAYQQTYRLHRKPRNEINKIFGITYKEYENLLHKQNNVCAICGNVETSLSSKKTKIKRLSVDHDHQTNKIRGLLCNRCNLSLGGFNDDIALLQQAIKYLKRHIN